MEQNAVKKMKSASKIFKKAALKNDGSVSGWLTDNYYILESSAVKTAAECKNILKTKEGSETFPGIFDAAIEICKNGILPERESLTKQLGNVIKSSAECTYIPLALTCALTYIGSQGVEQGKEKGTKLLSNCVKSLRKLSETDFEKIIEQLNPFEQILNEDPAGIYPVMDNETKNKYRKSVSFIANKTGKTEFETAKNALERAKKDNSHIGKYLYVTENRKKRGTFFLFFEVVFPMICAVVFGVFFKSVSLPFIIYFPLFQILKLPIDRASLRGVKPSRLPSLDPNNAKALSETLIVVSTLMPEPEKADKLGEHLENVFLSNRCTKFKVCCLADLKSAEKASLPEDKAAAKAMKSVIDSLNKRYGGGFIFALRGRSYSETQNEFTGKERKRGAITELVRTIKGDPSGFEVIHGDLSTLHSVEYIAALDADTETEFDGIRELVAVANHPLNKPYADVKKGRVTDGYGILVPLSVNRLNGGNNSFFASVMSGENGLSAYNSDLSEKYNDLFGEGIFCGKGLINVEAYYRLLNNSLPKEKILSHDIIEGGYLRAGYVPRVQMTDGFPQSPISYYTRLERWIRGDWQNLPFIFKKNPLNCLSRYKLADNLRRSITPVICAAGAVLSVFYGKSIGVFICAVSMLAVISSELFSGIFALINGGFSSLSSLFYSRAFPAALGAFTRAFFSLAFFMRESTVSFFAITKALWRMAVSKKNLLEWTTAAGGEKRNLPLKKLGSCVPSVLFGLFLFLTGGGIQKLLGIFLFFDIPIEIFSDRKSSRFGTKLSEKSREKLLGYTASAWEFFEEQCGRENNFLPPDNIQFAPARAVAKRTSPTNIGLMLTSFLAARDLGFITTGELCTRLKLSLTSIEKLEKYHGNLLNWYDIELLEPLTPKFVSTVDSGNFLCCLVALKQGLKEYAGEYSDMDKIIERINKLISDTELLPLYNRERELFYIGLNPETEQKSDSCYDLFMSEVRMTAYYAVAKRMIPKKHWGSMGRISVASGRYRGLISWTGTMFEYFMPELFIPSPVGSVLNESLHFCLKCQRKRCGGKPFGISESGFYAFDSELNYQYKAHGAQKIGLRRGLNDDLVISPYSSFLTLAIAPEVSVQNLSRLEKNGMCGKYGFFEAADYTRTSGRGFSIVSSYMAHHVGMSIVAADNALKNNCMQHRFMSDSDMRGAASLLEEKIPTGSKPFKDIRQRETPKIRERTQAADREVFAPSPTEPNVSVYSNGRMSCFISDCGTGVTVYDGMDINVRSRDILSMPQGVFGVLAVNDKVIPFVRGICNENGTGFSCKFMADNAELRAKNGNIRLKMNVGVLKNTDCEIRTFTVENASHHEKLEGKLIVYFEPCLEKPGTFIRHPAFSRLFVTDEYDEQYGCMIFRRRNSREGLSCAVAAGFDRSEGVKYCGSREKVLCSPLGIFSLGIKKDFGGQAGNPDCCCAFEIDIKLEPKEKVSRKFIISADESPETAVASFLSVKASRKDGKYSENPFCVDAVTAALSGKLLPCVVYPVPKAIKENVSFSLNDLWSLGISGDIPVISVETDVSDDVSNLLPYIRFNKFLRNSGMCADLAIVYSSDEGYLDPVSEGVKRLLHSESCSLMTGIKGGIHLINSIHRDYKSLYALKLLSALYIGTDFGTETNEKEVFKPLDFELPDLQGTSKYVKDFYFTEGKISIEKSVKTADIPWVLVLSNKSFGTMVSDKALGFTWALNSGENKITAWHSDNMSDNRSEMLLMKKNGKFYDLAMLSDVIFTPGKAEYNFEKDGLKITFSISVPDRSAVKKCEIKIENRTENSIGFGLIYSVIPVLGESGENASLYSVKSLDSGGVVSNAPAPVKGYAALQCDGRADRVCFSRRELLQDKDTGSTDFPCVAVEKNVTVAAGGTTWVNFYLSWGQSEFAAIKAPFIKSVENRKIIPERIESGNKNLDIFCNSFLYGQIKNCRFFARTGFYQCSGAYGFRDQLQDSLAFLDTEPYLTKIHLIRCAAVQFEQGDVLHWWHETVNGTKTVTGVRTKCSDDMLWLPYVFCEYLDKTGDESIVGFEIPYMSGRELKVNEKEHYTSPVRSELKENIFLHCIRAVDRSLKFGENGLPLIGSCDWNDGFSNAGSDTKGESVWLAMFQIIVLNRMSSVCLKFGNTEKADEYSETAKKLTETVESFAWDGDRYMRAVLKNGMKLGKNRDFIDILPQAFAAFAGVFDEQRVKTALNTAYDELFDGESNVIKLLSPPFDEYERDTVGYIGSYPQGIRENGGQYTHGAVWLAMAFFKVGDVEKGVRLLEALNPLNRYDDMKAAEIYRAEPYVLAGDVSGGKTTSGRAGWTHFTGSAAWFMKCVKENLPQIQNYYKKYKDGNVK